MNYRFATDADIPLLARWNHALIRDEGHRNAMTIPELETRMQGWLASEYRAVIFERYAVPSGEAQGTTSADTQAELSATTQATPSAGVVGSQLSGLAYALYRENEAGIYLRQFYVAPEARRQGIGRAAIQLLRNKIWDASKRLTVDVLTSNAPSVAFWRACGFADYCLTLEIMPLNAH